MHQMTTGQTATAMTNHLAPASPIRTKTVRDLIAAGAFPATTTGSQARINSNDLDTFLNNTRLVAPGEFPGAHVFRVSVRPMWDHEIRDASGAVLRSYAGVDYANRRQLSKTERRAAWEGVWSVTPHVADDVTHLGATLVGSMKGYVHPRMVRTVFGWHEDDQTGRVWFDTTKPVAEIRSFVGTGVWVNIPEGHTSGWL